MSRLQARLEELEEAKGSFLFLPKQELLLLLQIAAAAQAFCSNGRDADYRRLEAAVMKAEES